MVSRPWGATARALMTLSFRTHTVINPVSDPAERMPSGAACWGAGMQQPARTNRTTCFLPHAAGQPSQALQTRTGRGTARQPSEASAAVHGASPCHRCWAATAASSTTRALAVFACAERVCALQMPSNVFRVCYHGDPSFCGSRRGWLRGPERPASTGPKLSVERRLSSVERLFLTYSS